MDDPLETQARAIAAGALASSPIEEHAQETLVSHPIKKLLQGGMVDPFGHHWLIGKILELPELSLSLRMAPYVVDYCCG